MVDHVGQGSFQWSSVTAHPQPATAGWDFKLRLESHGSKSFTDGQTLSEPPLPTPF